MTQLPFGPFNPHHLAFHGYLHAGWNRNRLSSYPRHYVLFSFQLSAISTKVKAPRFIKLTADR
jgi:hypothetical protein